MSDHTLLVISVVSNAIVAFVTVVYVIYTRYLVHVTQNAYRHQLAPIVGVNVGQIEIGEEFGPQRRNLSVELCVKNIGNAAAIDVQVDSEIEFRYSEIEGVRNIPMRFEPSFVPYLAVGDVASGNEVSQSYGNRCIDALLDDARESHRLNSHRIATDPSQEPYNMSRLKIFVYYKNAIGQSFRSCFTQEISVWKHEDIEKKKLSLTKIFVPRPEFIAMPIDKKSKDREMSERRKKRNLCGW